MASLLSAEALEEWRDRRALTFNYESYKRSLARRNRVADSVEGVRAGGGKDKGEKIGKEETKHVH